jgi:hypothetical protein
MRRLLFLLVGLMAFGTMLPNAPVAAATAHHRHAMPPGHCGDESQPATHICLGCAVDPAAPPAIDPIVPMLVMAPTPRFASKRPDHRSGFDPPPPRALG